MKVQLKFMGETGTIMNGMIYDCTISYKAPFFFVRTSNGEVFQYFSLQHLMSNWEKVKEEKIA